MAIFQIRQSRIRSCAISMDNLARLLSYQRARLAIQGASTAVGGTEGNVIRNRVLKQAEDIAALSTDLQKMKVVLERCVLVYEECEEEASSPITMDKDQLSYREILLRDIRSSVESVAKIVF